MLDLVGMYQWECWEDEDEDDDAVVLETGGCGGLPGYCRRSMTDAVVKWPAFRLLPQLLLLLHAHCCHSLRRQRHCHRHGAQAGCTGNTYKNLTLHLRYLCIIPLLALLGAHEGAQVSLPKSCLCSGGRYVSCQYWYFWGPVGAQVTLTKTTVVMQDVVLLALSEAHKGAQGTLLIQCSSGGIYVSPAIGTTTRGTQRGTGDISKT